jgi:hypothetical protein
MKSPTPGTGISDVEVTNISLHGFWLFVEGKEYFLAFEGYPWFKDAKVSDILAVELLHGSHLHWPALDVDLAIESLEDPEKYPLIYE